MKMRIGKVNGNFKKCELMSFEAKTLDLADEELFLTVREGRKKD